MKRKKFPALLWLVVPIIALLLMQASPVEGASFASGSWKVVPTPKLATNAVLHGVSAVSSSNAWAVGSSFNNNTNTSQTLIEHWNGTRWSVVPSPNPSPTGNTLNAVAKLSATNVWAVGSYNGSTGGQTLIEHWTGTKWSVVPSPNPGNASNSLLAISAFSSKDIWAVGAYANSAGSFQTLTEHWNGTKWSFVPSPSPGSLDNTLNGVTVLSATDAWAVGDYFINPDPDQVHNVTLILHWNGTAWTVVSSPSPTDRVNVLHGVAAVSATNVWAVGNRTRPNAPSSIGYNRTMVQRWNGTKWSVVPSPNHSVYDNALLSVAVISASNIWAVGNYDNGQPPKHTLTEQWDGTSWRVVASPNVGTDLNSLESVARVPGTQQAWAVGEYFDTTINAWRTLAEYYS